MNLELAVKGDIRRLHLEPGDALLVTLHDIRTEDRFDELAELIRSKLELLGFRNRFVIVAGEQVEFSVAERPEGNG